MWNPIGILLLLGTDSACASAAIRLLLPRENLKWQLPAAFALCDGFGAFLGCAISPGYRLGGRGSQVILIVAFAAAAALLLALSKMASETRGARSCRALAFLAIPILLATDNLLAGESSLLNLPTGTLVAATGAASYLMSVLGVAIGESAAARFARFGQIVLASAALLILAAAVG